MAQQRCQIWLDQPNVCSVGHYNFTTVKFPGKEPVCVYARPSATALCTLGAVLPSRVDTQERRLNDTARAMLRLRDVAFPCPQRDRGGLPQDDPFRGVLHRGRLLVESHPH